TDMIQGRKRSEQAAAARLPSGGQVSWLLRRVSLFLPAPALPNATGEPAEQGGPLHRPEERHHVLDPGAVPPHDRREHGPPGAEDQEIRTVALEPAQEDRQDVVPGC